jgi:hypothetical protein
MGHFSGNETTNIYVPVSGSCSDIRLAVRFLIFYAETASLCLLGAL